MAALFGMQAGLFVPSGTMSNQLALKVLAEPSNEVLIDHKGHILQYETGGASSLSSVQLFPLVGNSGKLRAEQIAPSLLEEHTIGSLRLSLYALNIVRIREVVRSIHWMSSMP